MIEDENESGNLVEVRRSRAPSLILPSPTHPALLPPHSRSLGSSRPASSPSTRPCQLPAVQASLPLTEQAKCRDFLHVLAARDEPAPAPVVVVCCCITLCLSLCGSLWWCGVCRRGRSEWRSECAVTFHRVCMVWGHVYYDSKHSDSPGHVSTKQGLACPDPLGGGGQSRRPRGDKPSQHRRVGTWGLRRVLCPLWKCWPARTHPRRADLAP